MSPMVPDADRWIAEVVTRERSRLGAFIRRRVADPSDAEDVLQDVFQKLVEANRLLMPIDHVTAWLFRVARNAMTDLFRKKRAESIDDETLDLEEMLPSAGDGPDAAYLRALLVDEMQDAIDDLPREQREVFLAHEIDGRSFKDISAATGVGINTLLSRKHYAVLRLRERLRAIYEELT